MSYFRYQPYLHSRSCSTSHRLAHLSQELDRLFTGEPSVPSPQPVATWVPPLNLFEHGDQFTVTVELPGIVAGQIELSVQEDVLTISGERPAPEAQAPGSTLRRERATGKFTRRIALPTPVESSRITATFQEGVLSVFLPKAEVAKPRRIDVTLN